jgi:hypothetical protein
MESLQNKVVEDVFFVCVHSTGGSQRWANDFSEWLAVEMKIPVLRYFGGEEDPRRGSTEQDGLVYHFPTPVTVDGSSIPDFQRFFDAWEKRDYAPASVNECWQFLKQRETQKACLSALIILCQGYLGAWAATQIDHLRVWRERQRDGQGEKSLAERALWKMGWLALSEGTLKRLTPGLKEHYRGDSRDGVCSAEWWNVFNSGNSGTASMHQLRIDLTDELVLPVSFALPDPIEELLRLIERGTLTNVEVVASAYLCIDDVIRGPTQSMTKQSFT